MEDLLNLPCRNPLHFPKQSTSASPSKAVQKQVGSVLMLALHLEVSGWFMKVEVVSLMQNSPLKNYLSVSERAEAPEDQGLLPG